MQHFIVEITYRIPFEQFGGKVAEHRAFLQTGFERGWLLFSGPQSPRTGGIVVARAPGLGQLQEFFSQDPYRLNGMADYRYIQFEPVKLQDFMADWVG
jgi:uncharacterized protein YciI